MKYNDPRNLSVWSAVYVTATFLVVYLAASLVTGTFHWLVFTLTMAALLVFTYSLSRT
ncbi:MAG: hypothetical protein IH599_06855, partial [Bacteroidales bacterium]|nr:hypothetical protein [Bacteroidales bacterium]